MDYVAGLIYMAISEVEVEAEVDDYVIGLILTVFGIFIPSLFYKLFVNVYFKFDLILTVKFEWLGVEKIVPFYA